MNQEYIVFEKQDLSSFLLNFFSKKEVKVFLKNNLILVNEKEINRHNHILDVHDKVRIVKRIDDILVLYEDKYFMIVEKPFNMLTVSDLKEKEKTLYHKVSNYVKEKNKNNKIFIVHRLDYETGGLLIFAKDPIVKEKLQKNWRNVKRGYQAVVHGKLEGNHKLVFHLKENKALFVYACKKDKDTKEAITNYHVVSSSDHYSLLDIEIETGRKHQIRVSFKEIGHPIVGDKKYGNDTFKHLYLYANELCFSHPITKKKIHIKRPVLKEFKKLV